MSMLTIARKEFEDAIRSWALVLVATLFAAVLAVLVYYQLYVTPGARLAELRTAETVVSWITMQMTMLVPVLGMMLGYKAIVGERESGSLKLLLTLPHSRLEVMLGKFFGRSAIVVTMAVGFALVGIQTILFTDLFSLPGFLLAAGEITLFGIIFVAIAMAFSTAMRTSRAAAIGALGLTILFSFLWDLVSGYIIMFVHPPPMSGEVTPPPN